MAAKITKNYLHEAKNSRFLENQK